MSWFRSGFGKARGCRGIGLAWKKEFEVLQSRTATGTAGMRGIRSTRPELRRAETWISSLLGVQNMMSSQPVFSRERLRTFFHPAGAGRGEGKRQSLKPPGAGQRKSKAFQPASRFHAGPLGFCLISSLCPWGRRAFYPDSFGREKWR